MAANINDVYNALLDMIDLARVSIEHDEHDEVWVKDKERIAAAMKVLMDMEHGGVV